jgi:uncharacterized DUF497 family protein
MGLTFEWEKQKAASNIKKHGVSFEEAASVFRDTLSMTVTDPDHSGEEERLMLLGVSEQGRMLVVCHTERGDNIRIFSARLATRGERKTYEED